MNDEMNAALDQAAQQPDTGSMLVGLILYLGIFALFIAANWRIFAKAGQPGWASLIPLYNLVVWMKMVQRPMWWVVMLLIPVVNIFFAGALCVATAKAFGKGLGYGLGLFFLGFIFWPMLAFGSSKYVLGGTTASQPQMAMAA